MRNDNDRLLTFGLCCIVFSLLLAGCDPCENESAVEHPSPDGKWKIVVFERGCGATVGTNVQMSLLQASRTLPSEAGNLFAIDSNHGASALEYIFVDWTSNSSVTITYPVKARVFKQEKRIGDVIVNYISK
jgi:hypothetical protein